MSRSLTRLFVLPALGGLALALATAAPASAQQSQIPRGNENGGETGGGGRGSTRGDGAGGGAGNGMGSETGGGATGNGDGMASADEIFADGVQREGAPLERGIGNTPGAAGAAGAARGMGGLGGFGGMGGFGGLGGFGGMSPFGGQFGGQSQQTRTVRTRLSSRVDVAPLPARAVGAAVRVRLATEYGNPRFQNVNIRMEGRTAILTGQVASDEDRRMARLLVQLEPGVSRIDNRLEVASQP